MKQFNDLFQKLDRTTKILPKVAALAEYFEQADERDKLWAIALLADKRPRRAINTNYIKEWAAEAANIPLWLFKESHGVVGDLGETISLVLPEPSRTSEKSLADWMELLIAIREHSEEEKRDFLHDAWDQLNQQERFLFNKLVAGQFRMGVSQKLMVRGLSKATGVDENKLAHRLMGNWEVSTTDYQTLIYSENKEDDLSRPYPFYLAYQLEQELPALGLPQEWQVERKWDGIGGS